MTERIADQIPSVTSTPLPSKKLLTQSADSERLRAVLAGHAVAPIRREDLQALFNPGILHDGRALLTQETFAEVVRGLDVDLVGNVLEAIGILRRKDDQKKAQVSIAELEVKKQRFYHLDLARLLGDAGVETAEDAGDVFNA